MSGLKPFTRLLLRNEGIRLRPNFKGQMSNVCKSKQMQSLTHCKQFNRSNYPIQGELENESHINFLINLSHELAINQTELHLYANKRKRKMSHISFPITK